MEYFPFFSSKIYNFYVEIWGVYVCGAGVYLFIYLFMLQKLFIHLSHLSLLLRMKELSFVFHFSNFFMSNILNGFSQPPQPTAYNIQHTTTQNVLMWIIVRK